MDVFMPKRQVYHDDRDESSFALKVKCFDGSLHRVLVSPGMTLWRLMEELRRVGVLGRSGTLQEKLILHKKGCSPIVVSGSQGTVEKIGITASDFLLILPGRSIPRSPEPPQIDPVPDAQMINAAIEAECQRRRDHGLALPNDPHIPASIYDSASRLAGYLGTPSVFESRLRLPVEANAALLQQLVEMGFSEPLSRRALVLHRNVLESAAEWLVDHPGDVPSQPQAAEARIEASDGASTQVDSLLVDPTIQPDQQVPPMASEESASMDPVDLLEAASLALRSGLSALQFRQAIAEMRDNPEAISRYLEDPEVGPILGNFLRAAGNHHQ